jgi:hypothetical protein
MITIKITINLRDDGDGGPIIEGENLWRDPTNAPAAPAKSHRPCTTDMASSFATPVLLASGKNSLDTAKIFSSGTSPSNLLTTTSPSQRPASRGVTKRLARFFSNLKR